MGADEAPRVVVDFSGFHGTVLLLVAESRGGQCEIRDARLAPPNLRIVPDSKFGLR
jgi:hypothetical protein